MTKKIFISYSSKQTEFADRIKVDLEKEGFEVWLDKIGLKHTIIWTQDLTEALINNDCVLLLWSSDAHNSENVKNELITAKALLKPIIPLLVDGEPNFPPLPQEISFLQGIVRDKYEDSFAELLTRLSDDELRKIRYPILDRKLHVPQDKNQYFVGRQAELVKLFVNLCGPFGIKSRNNPYAIIGLAGIGKTELALEFAYCFSALFPKGVYWIDAGKEDLASEFVKLAPHLILQQLNEESQSAFAKRILNHLRNLPESLLVLDGLTNKKALSEWCPAGGQSCAVLITTRLNLQDGRIQILQLKELDEKSAFQLLVSRRPDLTQKDVEVSAAKNICKLIGNFPLVLERFASHFAAERVLSPKQFFDEMEKVPFVSSAAHVEGAQNLLTETSRELFSLFNSIYKELNREQIDQYFFLMSSFAVETSIKHEFIVNAFNDSKAGMAALQQLRGVSLIFYEESNRINLHPLVVAYARALHEGNERAYQENFVKIMSDFIRTHNAVKDIDIVLPETLHLEHAIKTASEKTENTFAANLDILYTNYAKYLGYLGKFDQQLGCLQKALEISQATHGERHHEYIERLISLAYGYYHKGDWRNAIRELEKTKLLINQLHEDHRNVLAARMHQCFSEVYRYLGDFNEALENIKKSIKMIKMNCDESHPLVADALEVQGRIYCHQCNFTDAKLVLEHTLKIRKSVFGNEHHLVGNTLHDFGIYHLRKGEYRPAIDYFKKALQISRQAFGEKHPDYIERSISLTNAYYQKNDYEEALNHLEKTRTLIYGLFRDSQHPLTARMLLWFGEVYRRLGDFKKALEYTEQSCNMKRQIYGESHPSVADALEVQGKIYYHQCKFDNAKNVLEQTLSIRKKAYGNKHPLVGNTLDDFGEYHLRKGEYEDAIGYFRKALEISQIVIGEKHPDYIERSINLANGYYQKSEYSKALEQLEKTKELVRHVYKHDDSPLVARMLLSLGEVHRRRGEFKKALKDTNDSIKMKKAIYGESHPSVADALEVLVKIYYHQCKFDDAKTALEQILQIRKRAYGEQHPLFGNTLHEFGSYHLRKGEYDTAIGYFEKALEMSKSFFGENHLDCLDQKVTLASAFRLRGDNDSALKLLKETSETMEAVYKNINHPTLGRAYLEISHVYRRKENLDAANEYIDRSIKIKRKIYGRSHPSLAESLQAKAKLWIKSYHYTRAQKTINSSLDMRRSAYGPEHPEVANALNELGCLLTAQKKYRPALHKHTDALRIKRVFYGDSHPEIGKICMDMGITYRHCNEPANAMKYLELAHEIDNNFLEITHPYLAKIIKEMGVTLGAMKYYQSAIATLKASLAIYERNTNQDSQEWVENLDNLGLMCISTHRADDALKYLEEAFGKKRGLYGENHVESAKTLFLQGKAYLLKMNQSEAKQRFEQALKIYRENPAWWRTLETAIKQDLKDGCRIKLAENR